MRVASWAATIGRRDLQHFECAVLVSDLLPPPTAGACFGNAASQLAGCCFVCAHVCKCARARVGVVWVWCGCDVGVMWV